jgi:hypothetical protein
MAEELIQLNAETQEQCQAVRTRLNAESFVRLYTDNITPDPDTAPGGLTEASYTDYAEEDLTGRWEAVQQDETGVYSTVTDEITFAAPSGGASETIRLVGLEEDGVVRWLAKLTDPWVASVGGLPLRLQVRYQQFSASVLPL